VSETAYYLSKTTKMTFHSILAKFNLSCHHSSSWHQLQT